MIVGEQRNGYIVISVQHTVTQATGLTLSNVTRIA
jgi:hypothetical protein